MELEFLGEPGSVMSIEDAIDFGLVKITPAEEVEDDVMFLNSPDRIG